MFCTKCGAQNNDDAVFCAKCGTKIGSQASNEAASASENAPVKTQTGLERNFAALLSYLFGWISGLIFYFVEKDSYIRFHAMQSIIVTGAFTVLQILMGALGVVMWRLWVLHMILNTLIIMAFLALWIFLMVMSYKGERFKLPLIGDLAETLSK
jgi:uncharacterized membrane protein